MIRNVRLIFSRALRQCFFLTKGFGSAELANHTLQQYPPKKRWMKRNRSWRSRLWVPRETGDSVFALKDRFAAGNEPAARLKRGSQPSIGSHRGGGGFHPLLASSDRNRQNSKSSENWTCRAPLPAMGCRNCGIGSPHLPRADGKDLAAVGGNQKHRRRFSKLCRLPRISNSSFLSRLSVREARL